MLTILKENREHTNQIFIEKNNEEFQEKPFQDIFVQKTIRTEEEQKDGSILIKFRKEKTNLTKRINETAKLIKNNTAEQKLDELKKLISKEK